MFKNKIRIFSALFCLLLLIPLCCFGYIYYKVARETATRIDRGVINRVIASESPVYYDDGRTPIGVFFEKTHCKYLYYKDIPRVFIKSLIAAEDKIFFSHIGFDLKAIIRALLANIRAGKVVQGGSTITQQTAKNIFKREKRSYEAKLKGLIRAYLLERKYTKEEILEMYVNQFFVTGYGKGLSIAAQYFFGKEAEDLDLVEAAFIAGSVKGPNRYNPFIKKNEAEEEKARQLAKSRKDYVLGNMLTLNFITKDQYLEAKDRPVPFKEGQITYRLNVILDYIREQLESHYFRTILQEQGVVNPATSGIGIFTSVNKDIQGAAMRSLRSHLISMDVMLNGYSTSQISSKHRDLIERGLKKPSNSMPFISRITHIDAAREKAHLVVTWKHGGGVIDYEGVKPVGEAFRKWKYGKQAQFNKNHVLSFLDNFHVGDLVLVQFAVSPDAENEKKLMLSKIPELEGGIVVLQKGMIKAMVGGFSNRFFNRAVDARRQLGSIFKPIVYAAALQLKWNSLDALQNIRDIYQFENTFYMPRPDHKPKSDIVSMIWAGAKSENLATVWLLYHLTDRLNMNEFRQVTNLLGLGRGAEESYQSYKRRIRDRYGVVVDKEALMEAAFCISKKEVASDIIFEGYAARLLNLNRLHYNIGRKRADFEEPEERQIIRFDFKRLCRLNKEMKEYSQEILRLPEQYSQYKPDKTGQRLSQSLRHFYRLEGKDGDEKIVYTKDAESLSHAPLLVPLTLQWLQERGPLPIEEVLIDGLLTSKILDLLQTNMKEKYRRLVGFKRYDPEVLFRIRDFRTLVNLSYVVLFSKKLGISTRLDPVLSFPLGPSSISIIEAGLAYQTLMTGQFYPLSPDNNISEIPIITRIVDRGGEIIWEYKPKPERIMSDEISGSVNEILRNVIEMGTGIRAKHAVRVYPAEKDEDVGIRVPCFGKTGTANRFTNSGFVGLIPAPNETTGRLCVREGYIIGGYVGYDDNRPMERNKISIYGSSGALPLWIDTANAIAAAKQYREKFQPAGPASDGFPNLMPRHGKMKTVSVLPLSGLPTGLSGTSSGPSGYPRVLADMEDYGDTRRLKRRFELIEKDTGRLSEDNSKE